MEQLHTRAVCAKCGASVDPFAANKEHVHNETAPPREMAPSEFHRLHEAFRKELQALLNRHSMENGSDTPDFLLADYLIGCLAAFNSAVNQRDTWHGFKTFGRD